MNNKLAQAVKLYDNILTQQVSRPTWRQQTTSPAVHPYNQWDHEQSPVSVEPPHSPATQRWQQSASVYAPSQAYQAPAGADTPYPPSTHSPQQAWTQPMPFYVSLDANPSPAVTASQVSPQYQSGPAPQSPVSQQYQYAHPTQSVSIQPPIPQTHTLTHVVGRAQQHAAPVSVQSPTAQQISSPPPVHQQPPSRHSTLSHAVHVPSTISQQQYAHAPTPAPALPNFPSVPTAPPTIPYGSYESASSAVEQPKKEALLIEL